MALTDESKMPFGQFKGRPLEDVPAGYLLWVLDQEWIVKYPDLVAYIKDCEDVLRKEVSESK